MQAVALTRYTADIDHPDAVFDTELPLPPRPQGHDVLVNVRAVSVNQLDNRVRRPKDKVESAPRVIGFDAAGVVTAVGPEVTAFRRGDRIYYSGDPARPGSHAEYQLVDERIAGRMPDGWSFAQAAALPLAALTAWELLFDRLRVPRHGAGAAGLYRAHAPSAAPWTPPVAGCPRSALIIGAAGGVGSMAVQLAARVAGLRVVATASRPESRAWAERMGAHDVIDHFGDLQAQLEARGLPAPDYVLILADTDRYYPLAAKLVAPQGAIGLAVEATLPVDIGLLWDKSVTLTWEMAYTRVDYGTPDLAAQQAILHEVAALAERGVLQPIDSAHQGRITAANLRAAHRRMASGRMTGKLVLEGFGDV